MNQIASENTPAGIILAALGGGRRLQKRTGANRICESYRGVTFGIRHCGTRVVKIVMDHTGLCTVQLTAQNTLSKWVETGQTHRVLKERSGIAPEQLAATFTAMTGLELGL
jgi:hypothetical protein